MPSLHGVERRLAIIGDVPPSGADGRYVRRDHWRVVRARLLAAAAVIALAFPIFSLADRWPLASTPNLLVSLSGLALFYFGLFLLALAAWRAVRALLTRRAVTAIAPDAGAAT